MFRLHETTRRQMCRAAFGLLCLAPALGVCGLGAVARLPGQTALVQRQLSERLGLRATLLRVEKPRPGVTRFVGLELADPETGQTILHAKQAELTLPLTGGKTGQIVLVEPRLDAERFDSLRQLVLRALRRELGEHDLDLRFTAATFEIDTPAGPVSLVDASGGLKLATIGSEAWIRIQLAPNAVSTRRKSADPIHVKVVRNRESEQHYTGFELYTHGQELPCDMWMQLLGIDVKLGRKARFRGFEHKAQTQDTRDVVAKCIDGEWDATVRGSFVDVDAQRLLGAGSPHHLDGRVTLDVAWAKFERGRLVQADCSLAGGPGHVSRSLLTAAMEELGMRGAEPTSGAGLVAFDQLAARVQLDRQEGLTITGHCDRAAGVLLLGPQPQRTLLLVESETPRQPIAGLVRMLSPTGDSSDTLVPATRQAASLLNWLPLPESGKSLR